MTSRKRMMSCRAEKRTCRFRGVVEGPAMEKPEVGNRTENIAIEWIGPEKTHLCNILKNSKMR